MATQMYSEEEVSAHNTKEDCWVIIHDGVYNVTKYLSEHPGGDLVLIMNGGLDATDEFEDNGHSDDARELMKEYKIGEVIVDDVQQVDGKKIADGCSSCKWIQLTIATAAVAVIGFYVYRKRYC